MNIKNEEKKICSQINPIQDGEGKKAPYQFFPCNFYKHRI